MTPDEPNTPASPVGDGGAQTPAPDAEPNIQRESAGEGGAQDATPATTSPIVATPTDATPIEATPTAAQQSAADAAASEEGEGDDGDTEGEGEGAPADGTAAAPGAEGDKPKKKRRRRRKKKDGAHAPGAPGAEGAPAEGAAPVEGAEGAEGAPAGEAVEGAAEGGDKKGKRRERRPQRDKPPFAIGEEVMGKVTKVLDHAIMLDVAGKALGVFDRAEIPESETPNEGEQIVGKVVNDGARGGCVVLTKDLNRWQKTRLDVEAAFAEKKPIDGLVTGVIKGGIEVDVGGLRGFAPASHVDLRLGTDLHYMIGQKLAFDVVQFAKRGREFVLSRKSVLESQAKELRTKALESVKVGEVVKGIVRSVQPFGAFIDVGGIDGLCPPNEASHDNKPLNQIFKVNDEVDVKILRVDDQGKIWLSRRAAEHDPWVGAAERYTRGSRHKGKVVRLQPFGAFIELENGIDGLLHISDIFAPRRINHPNEVLKVGEEIDVVVSRLELDQRRIGLQEAPKEGEAPVFNDRPERGGRGGYAGPGGGGGGGGGGARLGPHSQVKAVVEGHEPGGLVVRIVGQTGRDAKGFIPGMGTGTPKGADLRKAFPVGTEVDAKIVEFRPGSSAKLSITALAKDQERQSFRQYQNEVKQAAKFGTFGDLLKNKGITK